MFTSEETVIFAAKISFCQAYFLNETLSL